MLSVRRATESDLQEWNEFVYSCPTGTIYHSREWCDIHRRTFNSRVVDLVAREEGKIVGVFPFKFGYYSHPSVQNVPRPFWYKEISSPVGDIENPYGGPVCSLDRPGVFRFLLLEAFHIAMPFGRARVVLSPSMDKDQQICQQIRSTRSEISWRETLLLDLKQSMETIESRFIPDVRRNLRKSNQLGVKIREAKDESEVGDYYRIIKETYLRSGFSPFPLSFYEDVFRTFKDSNQIKLLFAIYDEKPIATTAFLIDPNMVYSWTGGSLREYARYNGYTFIWRYMIENAKKQGHAVFDLTGIDRRLPGLARFKRSFGAELCTFPALKWHSPVSPPLDRLLIRHSERIVDIAMRHGYLQYFPAQERKKI
ncbi:MAG: peptidoglycan bridge formation glycyltransferase FemA/FemB family protein [Nitrososphaerota archaeon]|nr:peptidoglycan bridge formation glycyltransferase FemA/FemB family protein [Nitrososphaerota archaeon]